eukprot:1469943-Amphidinium_carterae.1
MGDLQASLDRVKQSEGDQDNCARHFIKGGLLECDAAPELAKVQRGGRVLLVAHVARNCSNAHRYLFMFQCKAVFQSCLELLTRAFLGLFNASCARVSLLHRSHLPLRPIL